MDCGHLAGDANLKKCPFCAEEILDEAIVCRYCRRALDLSAVRKLELTQATGRDEENTKNTEPKKVWLAVLLNSFPLIFGLGYIYISKPARFIAAFGIQLVSLMPMTLFGLRPFNKYLLGVWWIVTLFDIYFQTIKHNEGIGEIRFNRNSGCLILIIIFSLGLMSYSTVEIYYLFGNNLNSSTSDIESEVPFTTLTSTKAKSTPTSSSLEASTCFCPTYSGANHFQTKDGEYICVSGVARNVFVNEFLLRGIDVSNVIKVRGPVLRWVRNGDMVDVRGKYKETFILIESFNDMRICQEGPASNEERQIPLSTRRSLFPGLDDLIEEIRATNAACEANPNCFFVTVTPPWQAWTPESNAPTWTPSP